MNKVKIWIGTKEYQVEVAETEEQQEQGLQDRTNLPENEGMLFIFDEEEPRLFWMKNTSIPLDIIFIDDELTVTSVETGIPNSEDMIEGFGSYVLEVNTNSGITEGDELKFSQEKMLVLDDRGNIQMELQGGERIFSRAHTKTLIKFAQKANNTKDDKDYAALGRRLFKFLQVQEETPAEYVEGKN